MDYNNPDVALFVKQLKSGTYKMKNEKGVVEVPHFTEEDIPELLKYAEERPEEVNHVIVNKDGSMVCHVPVSFIKVSPPRKVSDKQRETARERFVKMWAEKQESGSAEEIPEDFMDEFLEEEI